MKTKTLMIKQLSRSPKTGDFDELNFEPGVNVLVGKPNTGKTQWLRMLNFLMGDRDSNVEKAFDIDLVNKYESIRGTFTIDNQELILERNWKLTGKKGAIFVDGEPVLAEEFSSILLRRLNIPVISYPQGNPLSIRKWPALSWPTMLRHVYRKQTSWGELAYKQPEVDQLACILQFLGIAEKLFSAEYEQLSMKQKDIYKRQVRKEEFVGTLNQIARELLSNEGLGVAVTESSINFAIQKFDAEVNTLLNQRTEILNFLRDGILSESNQAQATEFEQLSDRWAQLQSERNKFSFRIRETQSRLAELEDYRTKLGDESSRLERVQSAGQVFRDLRVTYCPVCEQSVDSKNVAPNHCYLCHRPTPPNPNDANVSEQRLDFEKEQLSDEIKEADELVKIVKSELESLYSNLHSLDEELTYVQSMIKPIQVAVAAILPPEISQIDMDLGRIQEQVRQLERIKGALDLQKNLSDEISEIEKEINILEAEVTKLSQDISFESPSSFLVSQMNTYLNAIKLKNPNSWTQGEIGLRLKEKSFSFTAGKNKVSSLGATMTLYFLPAYNYGLLSLSNKDEYHYPGLCILDFPPTFTDGSSRTDTENFILEPFIDLVNKSDMQNTQVIAVGSAFEGLENVHRIELSHIWK